jgi:tryptophan synthase alpha chain
LKTIDQVFSTNKKIGLMTHVVAGYPNLTATADLIRLMADTGVDLVEIQIPFSDPLADGPTIMRASQHALDNGVTTEDCFRLAEEVAKTVDIPLLFMTYGNIPFAMGMKRFMRRCADAGIQGLIVPDLPFDEETDDHLDLAHDAGLKIIQVTSPSTGEQRLARVCALAEGFIYATLKVGITGAGADVDDQGIGFLNRIRSLSDLPIAAGFGISSPEHVKKLIGKTDMAVIGSHVINVYEKEGKKGVAAFLKECEKVGS